MLMSKQIVIVFMALLFVPLAHAHNVEYIDTAAYYDSRYPVYDDSIESRLDRQQQRIDAGIRRGSLTAAEVRKLRHAQRGVFRLERRLEYNGNLCDRDLSRLHHRLDRISEKIYRLKHNRHVSRRYLPGHADWDAVTRIEYSRTDAPQDNYAIANSFRW